MEMTDRVCSCMNVTVGDIKAAIETGAKSYEDVQAKTRVATGCGACADSAKEIVEKFLAE